MEVSVKRGIKIVLFFLVILIASACGMDPMDLDHLSSQRADTESGLYETVKLSIENGASHVRSDVSIEIKFPRSLQRGAGNEKNIFLLDIADVESSTSSDERGGLFAGICDLKLSVPAAVSTYDRINFAIRPYDELKEGAVYALCILDSIVYQDGDTFPGMVASFRTMLPRRVKIAMTSPSDGEAGVSVSRAIKIVFDGMVDLSILGDENFEIFSEEGDYVNGALSYRENSPIANIAFEPDEELLPGTRYFARISGAFEDVDGECLAGRSGDGDCNKFIYEWSFVTAN
ncbi:MAG TPA: Ig-like domain-containing protein [bacterium]|nr:MAG: hypothetical protein BWY40_00544 [bacterium ADurb.Bin270]HPW45857.1 Ig-like domain-containing protein [bacterium]HQC50650.1 Ig-like domain-containing protein [bacterium]